MPRFACRGPNAKYESPGRRNICNRKAVQTCFVSKLICSIFKLFVIDQTSLKVFRQCKFAQFLF